MKAGEIVAEGGEIRSSAFGETFSVAPEHDPAMLTDLRGWWDRFGSTPFECFPVGAEALESPAVVIPARGQVH